MKLLFLFKLWIFISAKKYECDISNSTVYLQFEEIAFFNAAPTDVEAGSYPCHILFVLNDTNTENVKCISALRKYDTSQNQLIDVQVINAKEIYFNWAYYLEGYVIFENLNNNCPLESIARYEPFEFSDETQVLYLNNTKGGNNTSISPCKWRFTCPPGYGFKLVIQVFEFDSYTKLYVENRTDILVNKNSVKLNYPIYNSDTYFQVYLANSQSNLKFYAYMSIVPDIREKDNGTCYFIHSTPTSEYYTWGNYINDDEFGTRQGKYDNNQKCSLNLIIEPNTQAYVEFEYLSIEPFIDYVGYYEVDGNIVKFAPIGSIWPDPFVLYPYKNGTNKNITWEFMSDGNLSGFGFLINFQIFSCECSNRIVKCNDATEIIKNNAAYCNNLYCEFEFEPCESNITQLLLQGQSLSIGGSPVITTEDLFQVISNGTIVFEMLYSNIKLAYYTIYLNSMNKNILRVNTTDSHSHRIIHFHTSAFETPDISARVKLTPDNPTYILDAKLMPLTVFEISEEMVSFNYAFEIYRFHDSNIWLYDSENLTNIVKEFCNITNPNDSIYTCTIKGYKKFVVFYTFLDMLSDYPYAVIRLLNTPNKCVFENTLFHQVVSRQYNDLNTADIPKDRTISVIANPDQSCFLTFLTNVIEPNYAPCISKVWTSIAHENVKISAGILRNQALFEYNTTSQDYWKTVVLNTYIYTIEIPKKASAIISLSSIPLNNNGTLKPTAYIKISSLSYYSVVTTPCFGLSSSYYCSDFAQVYILGNYTVKFTAKYLNLLKNDTFGLIVNSKKIYYTYTGQSYIFHNQEIGVFYKLQDNYYNGAIMEIKVIGYTADTLK